MLCLKQKEFAEFLEVTRTTFGMAEAEQRELPTAAMIKLSALEREIFFACKQYDKDELVPEINQYTLDTQHNIIRNRITTKIDCDIATEQLKVMRASYEDAIASLFAVRSMLKLYPDVTHRSRKWFLIAEEAALKKMNDNHPYKQYLLEQSVLNYKASIARNE